MDTQQLTDDQRGQWSTVCLRTGFTLIELLVVISIIALLIGILLPALGAARNTARNALCLSNNRQILVAMASYTTDEDGYFPGHNTSGTNGSRPYGSGSVLPPERASAPANNADWFSPLLGRSLPLPKRAGERLYEIYTQDFRCPSQSYTYDSNSQYGAGWNDYPELAASLRNGDLYMPSYMSFWLFHVPAGPNAPASSETINTTGAVSLGNSVGLQTPDGYGPNIDKVGSTSGKAFMADGSGYIRTVERGDGATYDGEVLYSGDSPLIPEQPDNTSTTGSFMHLGPFSALNYGGRGCWKRDSRREKLNANAKAYGYRHAGETLNIGFFDGHASNYDQVESRNPSLFVPSGTTLTGSPASIYDSPYWNRFENPSGSIIK